MKLIVLLLSLGMFAFAQDVITVDAAKSKLEWKGEKVTGAHNGTINIKEGSLQFDKDKLVGGAFKIDMTTIINLDLESEQWNKKLVDHLNSDDFFSTEKHPVADFQITSVAHKDGNMYSITGDMTIKGITHAITFDAMVMKNKAEATILLDRTKWNVRYGSGKFFEGLGDRMIYDEFEMKVSLAY